MSLPILPGARGWPAVLLARAALDPEAGIEAAEGAGAWEAYRSAMTGLTPDAVISMVSEAGLRVLGLGRLLARVPRTEVLAWEVRPVRPLRDFGGWGIRGGGTARAFIWSGRRALRLLTTTGTIWLGHDDPDRLAAHCERWRSPSPP